MKKNLSYAKTRIRRMIILGVEQFRDPYYQGVAAQLAFFLFLSILPTLILLSQILGLFRVSLEQIQDWLNISISGSGIDLISEMLQYQPSGANTIFLAIIAVWAASRAQFALIRVTNYTLTDGETTGQGYLKDRIRAMKTILIMIFTLAFSLVVLVYGPMILTWVLEEILGQKVAALAWLTLRWPAAAALYFLMISYMYYVLPTEKVPYRDIVPGSIFSSVGFLAVTLAYNLYTGYSTNYDLLYGSFSNIVALLMWFWFIAWVMCIGITLNRVWWATRRKRTIPIDYDAKPRRKPLNIL